MSFNKTNENSTFNKYNINVDLEEESSDNTATTVKYAFDLTSEPKNSVISIAGNATLKGQPTEVEKYLKQEDGQVPPIVVNIYKELFPLMYVISKDMKIPAPAHNLSQGNVSESSIEQTNDEKNKEKQTNEEQKDTTNKSSDSKKISNESEKITNKNESEKKPEQTENDQ